MPSISLWSCAWRELKADSTAAASRIPWETLNVHGDSPVYPERMRAYHSGAVR